jgi:hypothetical protein
VNVLGDNIDTVNKNTETLIDASKGAGLDVNSEQNKINSMTSSRTAAIKSRTYMVKIIFLNTITQYSPHALRHNVYIVQTTNRMPDKTLIPAIAFGSLVTVCWINETATNHVPIVALFNLGN